MTFPLDSLLVASAANPWSYLVFGVIGVSFGVTLEMAGFGDSRKLAGQFYLRELTVFKVMFTAIAVALVLLFGAVGLGLIDFSHVWVNPTYVSSGMLGGVIMGAGFIIGGFCPTTSLASASTGRIDGMMFMAGGFVGAFLFGETEQLFDHWYNTAGYYGRLTLDQVFDTSVPAVVLTIVVIAVALLWAAEQIERVVAHKDLKREPQLRKLGAAVLTLAALGVVLIGTPTLQQRYQSVSFKRTETIPPFPAREQTLLVNASKLPPVKPQTVTRILSADEMLTARLAFVSPAEAFRARYQQSIKTIYLDVREEADYNLYHISSAINIPLQHLQQKVGSFLAEPPANTVFITMGNGETAAVQAWKMLVANRVPNVYILEGGVNQWITFFGPDEPAFKPLAKSGEDQLHFIFTEALGERYKSCAPSPITYEKMNFDPHIVLQVKRDKGGGGCG